MLPGKWLPELHLEFKRDESGTDGFRRCLYFAADPEIGAIIMAKRVKESRAWA